MQVQRVIAAVATGSGALVAEVGGSVWCLFPWVAVGHVRGVDLSYSQASGVGVRARLSVRGAH